MTQTSSSLTYLFASISDSIRWETLLWAVEFTCSKGKHLCVPEQRGYFSKVNASVCSHVMLPRSKVPLLEVILQRRSDVQTRRNRKAVGADRKSALFEKRVLAHLFDVNNRRERMNITTWIQPRTVVFFFLPMLSVCRGMFPCLWMPPLEPPSTEPLIPSTKLQTSVKSTTCGFMWT